MHSEVEKTLIELLDMEQVFDPQSRRRAASLIEGLCRERDQLREALKPFADILDDGEAPEGVMLSFASEDGHRVVTAITADAFRTATALAGEDVQG